VGNTPVAIVGIVFLIAGGIGAVLTATSYVSVVSGLSILPVIIKDYLIGVIVSAFLIAVGILLMIFSTRM